jgi:hypothetical protein
VVPGDLVSETQGVASEKKQPTVSTVVRFHAGLSALTLPSSRSCVVVALPRLEDSAGMGVACRHATTVHEAGTNPWEHRTCAAEVFCGPRLSCARPCLRRKTVWLLRLTAFKRPQQ